MDNAAYLYRDFSNEHANISNRDRNEMCMLAYSFRNEKLLIFTLFLLAFLSFLTLILLYFVYKSKEVRRIYSLVESDLKFIFVIGFISYVVASLNLFIFFSYQFTILLIDLPACFYVTSGYFCFYAQIPFTSICPVICLFVFYTMFLERCWASFGFKSDGKFSVLLTFLILTLFPVLQFAILDPKIYENERVFCASIITTFDSNFKSAAYATVVFDFAISLMDFVLLMINKRRIQAYKKSRGFNLNTRFNLKSIEISIQFIYPISLVNSITFCFQSVIYFVYYRYVESVSLVNGVLMFEMCNLGRVMANMIVIGTVCYLNRSSGRKTSNAVAPAVNEADIYFRQFQAMIA